jgi:hypothetical protein
MKVKGLGYTHPAPPASEPSEADRLRVKHIISKLTRRVRRDTTARYERKPYADAA